LVVGAGYLVVSAALWWHAWSGNPSRQALCGCGDPALFMWFLQWPVRAASHGEWLLFSRQMFSPGGVNVLSNTSVLAISVPMAPITWLFGPVASLNIALTLAPALSATACYWFLRRWVAWQPAAVAGGLLYGFSPIVLNNLAFAHLMAVTLVVPPLMVACVEDLLLRHRHRPARVGLALAALAVVEFFISSEVLLICIAFLSLGILIVAVWGWRHRGVDGGRQWRLGVDAARVGLGTAAGACLAALALPVWYALAGPQHLSGPVWSNVASVNGSLRGLVDPSATSGVAGIYSSIDARLNGYYGPALPSVSFLGAGLVLVVLFGALRWRADRRLWFWLSIAGVSLALSLGAAPGAWTPWRLFAHLPVLEDVTPQRFLVVTFLAAAVLLALVTNHVHGWVSGDAVGGGRAAVARRRRARATLAGAGVLAVALVPIVEAYAPVLPFTVQTVPVPQWAQEISARGGPSPSVLTFPVASQHSQPPLAWQAVTGLQWSLVGGGGPASSPTVLATPQNTGYRVLVALSDPNDAVPLATAANVTAVRRQLARWDPSLLVIPMNPMLPSAEAAVSPRYAVSFLTAVLGRVPRVVAGSWQWALPGRRLPSRVVAGPLQVKQCARSFYASGGPMGVPSCVLGGR